jgi:alanine dehydrogenase
VSYRRGHDVLRSPAQAQASCRRRDYKKAGARILPTAEAVFAEAEMIVKVKSPRRSSIAVSSRTRSPSPPSPRADPEQAAA